MLSRELMPWQRQEGQDTVTRGKCCGSGIQCLSDPWIRDPGSGMGKKLGSGSGMNNRGSYFRELKKTIFWVKILKFFDADPGWKNILIRDPG
jgi:hypothetical protein